MSNIATGIGLSGKERADTRGLEYLVGAERDMAGQREAKRKSEEAARQKLIDDILKNTAFDQEYENIFYQKEFERDASEKMATIMEAIMNGQEDGTNLAVLAHKQISALERANRQRKTEDASMSAMNKAFSDDPGGVLMADPRDIDGKTYNSPQQALNALAGDPDAANKVAEAWNKANWYSVANVDPDTGRISWMFNPEMARVFDPVKEGTKFLKETGVFNVKGKDFTIGEGRTTVRFQGLLPDDDSLLRTNAYLFNDPRFGNTALLSAFQEARQGDPSLNFNDWVSGIDVREVVNTYAQGVMNTLRNYEGGRVQVSSTKPEPKEPSQSDSGKNADKIIAGGGFNMDGTIFEIPFTGTFQQERVVSIPRGATFITGPNSKPETVGTGNDIKATPVRIEWNPKKPMEGHIIYQSKYDPTGVDMTDSGVSVYTYRVPVTRSTINNIASLGGTDPKTFVSKIVERSSEGPVSEIEKWLENVLGVSSSGVPGPGQAPTGQQSPASGVIGQTAKKAAPSGGYSNVTKVKDANGNTIEIGVKNGKWYNTSTGQEVK